MYIRNICSLPLRGADHLSAYGIQGVEGLGQVLHVGVGLKGLQQQRTAACVKRVSPPSPPAAPAGSGPLTPSPLMCAPVPACCRVTRAPEAPVMGPPRIMQGHG
jgi:hypothetical protein